MKPANFPERVNQRRKEALARMEKSGKEYKQRERDMLALREKIEHNTMIGVRTKKMRSGTGKIR